jgi:hypothetical protein
LLKQSGTHEVADLILTLIGAHPETAGELACVETHVRGARLRAQVADRRRVLTIERAGTLTVLGAAVPSSKGPQ